jgi:hypothetical protein
MAVCRRARSRTGRSPINSGKHEAQGSCDQSVGRLPMVRRPVNSVRCALSEPRKRFPILQVIPMPRPAKKSAKSSAKKPSRLKQAAKQVASDADQVQQDLGKLLLSLEDLSVEALRAVADTALALISEKTGGQKRSLIGDLIGSAVGIGDAITGLFAKSDAPSKRKRLGRKARTNDPGKAEALSAHGRREKTASR